MLTDIKIECPKDAKKYKRGDKIKVYKIIEKIYKKDKKYNVDKRCVIGVMIDDKYMQPNENFFKYYPELYLQNKNNIEKSDCINVGLYIIIQKLLEELKLNEALDEIYDTKSNIIKDLVSYLIQSENNVIQHFNNYEYNHPLFNKKDVSDSYVSNMFKEMSISKHEQFLQLWNKNQSHNEKCYISYDSTNVSTSSEGVELAEYGHAKIDKGLPVVNTSLAFNETKHTPLFYENYPGSIIDNTEFSNSIETANRYGYTNIGFILDRGYFSKKNIKYLDDHNYDFIIMAKGNANFVKNSIDEAKKMFVENSAYYDSKSKLYALTLQKKLYSDDNKKRYIHVYCNETQGVAEKINILNQINILEEDIKKMINAKEVYFEKLKQCKKYFNIDIEEKKGKNVIKSYHRNEEEIQKTILRCGCFVIITSEKMDEKEALRKYRNRDGIEKIFLMTKSFLGEDIFRVHTDETLNSKQQMIFIATILRNEIFNKLSTIKECDNKNYTVPAVIRELEKVHIIQNLDGTYRMPLMLTKKQKDIFNCFDMKESEIKKSVQNFVINIK